MIDLLKIENKDGKRLCKYKIEKDEKTLNFNAVALINTPKVKFYLKQQFDILQYKDMDAATSINSWIKFEVEDRYDDWDIDIITPCRNKNNIINSFINDTLSQKDLNPLLRMLFAYDYTTKNIQKKMFETKSTLEIDSLSLKDIEQLNNKKIDIVEYLYDKIQSILRHKNLPDAQVYLDKIFGEGYVDLDEYFSSCFNSK